MQYAFVADGTVCVHMTHSNLTANHPDVSVFQVYSYDNILLFYNFYRFVWIYI